MDSNCILVFNNGRKFKFKKLKISTACYKKWPMQVLRRFQLQITLTVHNNLTITLIQARLQFCLKKIAKLNYVKFQINKDVPFKYYRKILNISRQKL